MIQNLSYSPFCICCIFYHDFFFYTRCNTNILLCFCPKGASSPKRTSPFLCKASQFCLILDALRKIWDRNIFFALLCQKLFRIFNSLYDCFMGYIFFFATSIIFTIRHFFVVCLILLFRNIFM